MSIWQYLKKYAPQIWSAKVRALLTKAFFCEFGQSYRNMVEVWLYFGAHSVVISSDHLNRQLTIGKSRCDQYLNSNYYKTVVILNQ